MILIANCSPSETTRDLTYLGNINIKEKKYSPFLTRNVPILDRGMFFVIKVFSE